MSEIVLGKWMYDEKEPPELSRQDAWLPERSSRELAKQGDQVLVPRDLLKNTHTHIRGKSGSGKDSTLILPLAAQLLQPYELTWEEADGSVNTVSERDAVIMVDLGGDKATFGAMNALTDSDPDREFHFLSLDANHSHKFDPFQSIPADGYRIIRLCNLFLEAFSLDHGLTYGGSWYSQRNLLLLLNICEQLVAERRKGKEITLYDVDRFLADPQTASIRDAEQIRGIFRFLLEYPQLQPTPRDKQVINVKQIIKNRGVLFAYLPAIAEATTARQIAGLVLYTAVNAAMSLYEELDVATGEQRPHPHTHIFVNEFHSIAGSSFEALLTGARKYNISLYLANQTTESLRTRDLDLSATVRDNCGVRIYQTVTGKQDIEELLTFSQETTRTLRSTKPNESIRLKGRGALGSSSLSEQVTTQLTKAEILDISSRKCAGFAIVDDGLGHREPIPLETDYYLSREEYLRFRATPLPKTATTPLESRPGRLRAVMPEWETAHLDAGKDELHQARMDRLSEALARLIAEERG
ncbi:hypothetical protein [Aeoliella sp.]|uniref:hypothetical protein n=1 Tax=Aeoliella sp. TaxID=2795800 RepID=UPI003CCC35C7